MVRPGGLRVEAVPVTHPVVARLVEEVQQEYVVRYGGRDETPLEVDELGGDRGLFLVGWLEGVPVATGAWRWHDPVPGVRPGPCTEIKRMYVATAHRGRGLGRQMLRALEQRASRAGSATMILETGLRQPEAIALYESAGYRPIPGFGHYRDAPLSRCFAKPLPRWEGNPLLRDALALHLEPALEALGVGFSFSSSGVDRDPSEPATGVPVDVVHYRTGQGLDLAMWFPREPGPPIRVHGELPELAQLRGWLAAERPGLAARLARATGDPEQDVAAVAEALAAWFAWRAAR